MEKGIIACDIDHTLSAAWWRDELIPPNNRDWDAYYAEQELDPPIEEWIEIIRGLSSIGHEIIGLTGRMEKHRASTTRWLVKHDVPIDEILMRPRNDYRHSPALKVGLLQLRCPGFDKVRMVIEDREDVAKAFRAIGVRVVQVTAERRMP